MVADTPLDRTKGARVAGWRPSARTLWNRAVTGPGSDGPRVAMRCTRVWPSITWR